MEYNAGAIASGLYNPVRSEHVRIFMIIATGF
ncbi:hypothetical protein HCH_05118 [Hahella chejuensis KCTC 2396]|uniref:Uncharacterized protein n=1 Tax=Hahella chejuensis (strain KCTC 2396) TaxID=349521 RepID=Q2SC25_HAHCH|nr:hypothetical protein HCH_05118 [Hahella chejuensis KCTC 2396]